MKKKIINIVCIVLILISICGNVFANSNVDIQRSSFKEANIVDPRTPEEIALQGMLVKIIGNVMITIQVLGTYGSIILIAFGIYKNFVAKKKLKLYENKLNTNIEDKKDYENDEEWKILNENKKRASAFLRFCIVIGITLFIIACFIGIQRHF